MAGAWQCVAVFLPGSQSRSALIRKQMLRDKEELAGVGERIGSQPRGIRFIWLIGVLLLLGSIATLNHLLTHRGFPLGSSLVFAPWFRGKVPFSHGFVEVLRSEDAKEPHPFEKVVRLRLEMRGTEIVGDLDCLLEAEQRSVDLSDCVVTSKNCGPPIRFSRWRGFFILEK
jgi:hypothetical protein